MTASIPFPHQAKAVEAFMNSDGHATLAMAPGSGKSVTACAIIKKVYERIPLSQWSKVKTLIVVPTLLLRDQWEKVAPREGIGSFEIVTYAWAAQHVDDDEFWSQFAIIVWDEVHHLGFGEVFMRLLVRAHPDSVRYSLGLTATPPQPENGEENIAMRVMPIVYTYTFSQGRAEGRTAEIEIRPIPVQLTPDERAKYAELTDKIKQMIAIYGGENYQNKPYGKDPTGETIWGGTLTNERRQLVALAEEKYKTLEGLLIGLVAQEHGRIFVWSEYVVALEKAKAVLNKHGNIAELVTGETPKKERRRIIEQAWGSEFPVLLVARVGEEGLDAPESAVGVILAGAKTSRQTVQRLGRLLRPFPGKKARLFAIFAERTTDEKIIPLLDLVTE